MGVDRGGAMHFVSGKANELIAFFFAKHTLEHGV